MKVKQSKKKEDFQNMSLDNFLDNMDADVGDDEPEVKPKGKLKSNGIEKAKTKQKTQLDKKVMGSGGKVKKAPLIGSEVDSKPNGVDTKKQKVPKPKAAGVVPESKTRVQTQKPELNGKGTKKKRKVSPPAGAENGDDSEDESKQPKANGLQKKKKKKAQKDQEQQPKAKEKHMKKKDKKEKLERNRKASAPEDSDEEDASVGGKSAMKEVEQEHQQALARLKTTDPELYAFLKQNDEKLLKFGQMDGSDSEEDDSEDAAEESEEGDLHELPNKLEVASDESDFDPDEDDDEGGEDAEDDDEDDDEDDEKVKEDSTPGKKITVKMLKSWTNELVQLPVKHASTIRDICKAFNSALYTVTGDQSVIPHYRVEGSAMFNGILQACVLYLGPAVRSYLMLNDNRQFKDLKNNRRFKKVRACLRTYLIDLTNLLENVSSSHIMSVLLKHLHQFSPILVCYRVITKPILKRLILIWSTAEEETIRVLAFMCILKITHAQQSYYLSNVLKTMYLAYVKNSKFVSPNTLPNINFMRRSLAELFLLNFNLSYQHMFLYIRQLAIHLRNAVILQKKDSYQYIYNWQYVNSLKLWGDVLAAAHVHGGALEPLVYPFVSITIGVIKLIPSAQYFPLRFHCCRILTQLNAKTRIFIPVLPFLTEVLRSQSFNEDHKKLSMRPVNLTCLIRFSAANIQENAFKDAVIEQVYELVLEFAANESASVAFPEIVLPTVLQLRQYAKATKQYKYSRKMKQLSDKLMENYEFMEKLRSKMGIPLKETDRIRAWEETVRVDGTPLAVFHAQVVKETEAVKRRHATDSEKISDYKLPAVKKVQKKPIVKPDGPVTLFPSDDEDDDDDRMEQEDAEDDSGEEGDDASMSDMGGDSDEDMGSEDDEEDDDEEDDEMEVPPKRGKSKVARKPSKPQMDSDEEFPVEDGKDSDQVDIVQELKLDEWDD